MLDHDYLKSILSYNKDTGIFVWKYREEVPIYWNTRYAGSIAGSVNKKGYIRIAINNKFYMAHCLAWFYVYGYWPKNQIDHKNTIKNHNYIDNLREATGHQNQQNRTKPSKNNVSGYLGVHFCKKSNKYHSEIMVNNKKKRLGYFYTKEEASEAYLKAKRELHPFSIILENKQ